MAMTENDEKKFQLCKRCRAIMNEISENECECVVCRGREEFVKKALGIVDE